MPNAAASSFVSSIIREPLAGDRAVCPVDPTLTMWVGSPAAAAGALHHAPSVPKVDWPAFGVVNVPGLQVSVADMLGALRARAGDGVADLVDYIPDPKIAAIVGTWPSLFDTQCARNLGFEGDADFDAILDQALRIK
jgi:hypothetical protein